jgi:hypothetical protein
LGPNLNGIILFALTVAWVLRRMKHDVRLGMRMIFALLVFLPDSLRIVLPARLLQITVHQFLIVTAFLFLYIGHNVQSFTSSISPTA